MTVNVNELEVQHHPERNRFEVMIDDKVAWVNYRTAANQINFTSTEVPPEFEGMGIGSKLARFVLDYAKAQGYRVQANCPFIAAYIRRHPEYQSITNGY
jgi:predicted GNAT family acetyltransferase